MRMSSYAPGTPSWVDLGSPEPDAAAAFYGALFGWQTVEMDPEAGGYRLALLEGSPVAGLGPSQQPEAPPYWATYVSVADVDATAREARECGAAVIVEPMDVMEAGRMAAFIDTTGAAISLWQPKEHPGAALVNEPGTWCWNELTTRQTGAATTFYRAVFGWEVAERDVGTTVYTEWKVGGRPVAGMMPMDGRWPADLPSHWMVYFAVADADASAEQVTDLGGAVIVPPMDIEPGRFAVVNDPHGAVFSLIRLSTGADG